MKQEPLTDGWSAGTVDHLIEKVEASFICSLSHCSRLFQKI